MELDSIKIVGGGLHKFINVLSVPTLTKLGICAADHVYEDEKQFFDKLKKSTTINHIYLYLDGEHTLSLENFDKVLSNPNFTSVDIENPDCYLDCTKQITGFLSLLKKHKHIKKFRILNTGYYDSQESVQILQEPDIKEFSFYIRDLNSMTNFFEKYPELVAEEPQIVFSDESLQEVAELEVIDVEYTISYEPICWNWLCNETNNETNNEDHDNHDDPKYPVKRSFNPFITLSPDQLRHIVENSGLATNGLCISYSSGALVPDEDTVLYNLLTAEQQKAVETSVRF